jgi:outer membrane protein assembly factor BamB
VDPASGQELRRISILEAVESSEFELLKEGSRGRAGDLYHTNAIWILDEESTVPASGSRRVMLYLLGLGSIVVLDMDSEQIVWASTGPETHRHDPRPLANGRILIFNNFHQSPESTVTELDPRTGEVLWRYQGSEQEPFYSKTCGTAQRLENGNTLITESDNGRAIEVNVDGQIVWEFVSPHRAGPEDAFIATLFELTRLPESDLLRWLPRDDGTEAAD